MVSAFDNDQVLAASGEHKFFTYHKSEIAGAQEIPAILSADLRFECLRSFHRTVPVTLCDHLAIDPCFAHRSIRTGLAGFWIDNSNIDVPEPLQNLATSHHGPCRLIYFAVDDTILLQVCDAQFVERGACCRGHCQCALCQPPSRGHSCRLETAGREGLQKTFHRAAADGLSGNTGSLPATQVERLSVLGRRFSDA